jgi:hypothetical protein
MTSTSHLHDNAAAIPVLQIPTTPRSSPLTTTEQQSDDDDDILCRIVAVLLQ